MQGLSTPRHNKNILNHLFFKDYPLQDVTKHSKLPEFKDYPLQNIKNKNCSN